MHNQNLFLPINLKTHIQILLMLQYLCLFLDSDANSSCFILMVIPEQFIPDLCILESSLTCKLFFWELVQVPCSIGLYCHIWKMLNILFWHTSANTFVGWKDCCKNDIWGQNEGINWPGKILSYKDNKNNLLHNFFNHTSGQLLFREKRRNKTIEGWVLETIC